MIELRYAQKHETEQQKKIWKLCFGDADSYIELFYSARHKAEETALLLDNGRIASMLTMLPASVVSPMGERLDAAILYAIATHPEYQGKGYASRLIEFAHGLLRKSNIGISILVPATDSLYHFYSRLGYKTGFYLHETVESCEKWPKASEGLIKDNWSIHPEEAGEYNQRREKLLEGYPYISYKAEEIHYQKTVSIRSGADIYALNLKDIVGCAAVERVNADRVLVKEILLPTDFLKAGIIELAKLLPAKEYILRMPVFLGLNYGGRTRPFAMYKVIANSNPFADLGENPYYLGLAFD